METTEVSTDRRMDKEIVCVCISAIKKNKILPPATVWMDFESITSSEMNQIRERQIFIISLICGI